MNEKEREILVITQEECAEVIQQVSKIFRFGIDNYHKSGSSQREALEKEVGDLLAMVELLFANQVINFDNVQTAIKEKQEKLKIWSNIYK
jgi:NTP pyrophosphatase (non-canonical NTP hydrolase)